MILEDFKYMWRGQEVKSLSRSDASLLKSINLQNKQNGKAILLLHGFTSSPAVYREIIPYLDAYDAIYCPILPGHANSIDEFSKATAEQWLDYSYNAYLSLASNYNKIDVLGLSLGGLLALKISEKFTVNHLYLLAPALILHGWPKIWLYAAFFLKFMGLKKIKNRGGNLHSDKFQEITYKQLPINSIIQLLSFIENYSFKQPNCPTDLFLGKFDEVVDSNAVANLFVSSATNKIHWLENSAHVLPIDGDYQLITTIIKENI